MTHGLSARYSNETLFIDFHSPQTANAFSDETANELVRLLKKHSKARVLVWRSRGERIFCGGGNLQKYAAMKKKQQGLKSHHKIKKALDHLQKFSCRKLVIVEGDCFGGGMELLSCFDEIWSVPQAAFGFWQRRVALTPGWGGFSRWCERVPIQQLKIWLKSSAPFGARLAFELGVVQRIVPNTFIENQLQLWIENEKSLPEAPLRKLNEISCRNEAKTFAQLWGKSEHLEALQKFSKRNKK